MGLPIQSAPKYTTVLPSDGREVEFRPFLVKEQKTLVLAREGKSVKEQISATKDLVRAVTFEKINPDELPMIDLEWLFLKIRSVSVGETVGLKLVCSDTECRGTGDVQIDLDEIEVTGKMPENNTVMINDEVGVTLQLLKVKNMDGVDKLPQEEQVIEILKRSIVSIFDGENVYNTSEISSSDINEFVDSLTYGQITLLGEWFDQAPKLTKDVSFKCNKCSTEQTRHLEGLQSFF
jgi:hypothetical protein